MEKNALIILLILGACSTYAIQHSVDYYNGNESYLYNGVVAYVFHTDLLDENCNYSARLTLELNGTETNRTDYTINMSYFDYKEIRLDYPYNDSCSTDNNFTSYYSFNSTDCNESFHYYNSVAHLVECPASTTTSTTPTTSSSSTTSTTTTTTTLSGMGDYADMFKSGDSLQDFESQKSTKERDAQESIESMSVSVIDLIPFILLLAVVYAIDNQNTRKREGKE